jgi:pimeloyl-ACP methyl ester carboxylesterase
VSLQDDAAVVRRELDNLISKGKEVIVVGHSWGGVVISEAVPALMSKQHRAEQGLDGGVLGLLYIAALLPVLGKSITESGQDAATATGIHHQASVTIKEDGTCTFSQAAQELYNDLSTEDAARWEAELRPSAMSMLRDPLTNAAYKHHPATFLFCENDKAVPVEYQKYWVNATGVPFREVTCQAGHSPFLSQPDFVVETICSVLQP